MDDDPTVADVVSRYLRREGFDVESVSDGLAAVQRAEAAPPDLVVLDLMLPGMSGLDVFHQLRATASVPVIMLTARSDEVDRVAGLELGADDYVPKPFSPRELTARVKTVLRRLSGPSQPSNGGPPTDVVRAGDLEVDIPGRELRRDGHPIVLTAREFDLLSYLVRHPHRVFRREELLEAVWDYAFGDTSTVTVHVRRVREKIERDPSEPRHIRTVWGVGYKFEP